MSDGTNKYRVLFVATHPIQYLSVVLRQLAADPRLDLSVAYCSMIGVQKSVDPDFGVEVTWDIPLLEGYKWVEVPNRSRRPAVGRFWGLNNPSIWGTVRKNRYDAIFTQVGYNHLSYWILALAAKVTRTPLVFETDATTIRGLHPALWKKLVKPMIVPQFFRTNDVIAAGSAEGVKYIRSLGLPGSRVVLVPFVVDNAWWNERAALVNRASARAALDIPEKSTVFVFCAKLQSWKRPGDALHAFVKVDDPNSFLVFAGDGPLGSDLEAEARVLGVSDRVRFLGFVNQSKLPELYAAADVLLVPSSSDACPVVVCEAMLCGCLVIMSDAVRGRFDLVEPGVTGYIHAVGNVHAIAVAMRDAASDRAKLAQMSDAARKRMESWSPEDAVNATITAIERAIARRSRRPPGL